MEHHNKPQRVREKNFSNFKVSMQNLKELLSISEQQHIRNQARAVNLLVAFCNVTGIICGVIYIYLKVIRNN